MMRRLFWRLYWPLAVAWSATLVGAYAGPHVEARLAPVHREQRVEAVTRTARQFCWDMASLKVRANATDDLDVFLYADGVEGRMVVAPYGAADGLPWRKAAAAGLGPWRKRYCVDLPRHVPASASVRLELTAWYPGWLGLWRVPQVAPPVVGPPVAEASLPPG